MSEFLSLQSVIDTHDKPFMVVNQALRVVAVNKAYESSFGGGVSLCLDKGLDELIPGTGDCSGQHAKLQTRESFFTSLEPFELVERRDHGGASQTVRVRGYPLHGADGVVYLGETVTPVADLSEQEPGDGIVGQSPAFLKAVERLRRAGRADTPVLIVGESGTGKELASRLVHEHSARSKGPFITVDCTVLGEGLIESELFGHERGAFTGSSGSKKGLFELADGGTLFLDELGELPLELQAKLLRAVEYGTFRRVGGTRTLKADVRVVAATNRSLGEMVREGRFRQDLFYRLAVFTVRLPPLRERPEDLQALVERFLAEMRTALDRPVDISPEALRRLQRHDFPGNIRELRNVMQVAATLCDQDVIGPDDLEFSVPERPLEDQQAEVEEEEGLKPLHKVEATYIGSLLRKYDFDRVKVAEAMGVSTRTLSRKMKRYNLNA